MTKYQMIEELQSAEIKPGWKSKRPLKTQEEDEEKPMGKVKKVKRFRLSLNRKPVKRF
jgi:hypothetical protein